MPAFSLFAILDADELRLRRAKSLRPWPEPKSTISGWTLLSVMAEHNTETEEIKSGEISQEAMMDGEEGTTKYAKGAKMGNKLL